MTCPHLITEALNSHVYSVYTVHVHLTYLYG